MIALVATARCALLYSATVVLAGLSLVSQPTASQAAHASAGVELSRDLSRWTPDLDDPLFLPGLPWQPGDTRSSTFFVRNETTESADVDLTLTRTPAEAPAADDYLKTAVQTRGNGTTALEPDGSRHVVHLRDLEPAQTVAVTLRADLSPAAPPGVMVDADVIDVRAAIGDTGGFLASAHLELAPLFLGFALIGASVVASWSRGKSRRS